MNNTVVIVMFPWTIVFHKEGLKAIEGGRAMRVTAILFGGENTVRMCG